MHLQRFNFEHIKVRIANYITLSTILIILSCCSSKSNDSQNNEGVKAIYIDTLILNVPVYLSSLSKLDFDKFKNSNKIACDTTSIRKNKDEIVLPLIGNKSIIFKDSLSKTDDTEQITYNYRGFYRDIGFYAVLAQYYETGEYILANQKTGSKTKIWGEPIISANRKNIISFSNAIGYDVMPNGIQLWEIQKDSTLKLKWEYQTDQWGPDRVEWINDNSIGVKKIIPDFISSTKAEEVNYIKMTW